MENKKNFELVSSYAPTGDQPKAIDSLVDGILKGNHAQTLLGVTGSGKTFTMANVIAKVNKPTLVLAHNSPTMQSSTSFHITIIISLRHIFRGLTLI